VSETLSLRHSVLWPDAPISHVCLPEDETGYHFGAFLTPGSEDQSHPVAIISLFIEPIPATAENSSSSNSPEDLCSSLHIHPAEGIAVRFRKFACDPMYQNQGVGTQLLQHVFSFVRTELWGTLVWCDARTSTADWYRQRGMMEFGNVFYKSEVQYIRMKINLE
jgi:GNAT superfamily N-acetyltransferase